MANAEQSFFRITDGKGFGMKFANGWAISVQFGYGNYADNYDGRVDEEDYAKRNARLGANGSTTAECAVFNANREMVKLPASVVSPGEESDYEDVVTNRSDSTTVLRLMNWAASQPT